jgi:hypothetical protein
MSTPDLENRMTTLEQELASLKASLFALPATNNHWIEKIAGTFSSPDARAGFDEAMAYGRQWRNAQRNKPRKRRASKKK